MAGSNAARVRRFACLALSHHWELRRSRTVGLSIFGWEQRFCTRCSAQWLAVAATVSLTIALGLDLPLAVLPAPALVDWITQTWGLRESGTASRLGTGALLGMGMGMWASAVVGLDYVRVLIGIGVLAAYSGMIGGLLALRPAHEGYLMDLVDEVAQAIRKSPRD